MPLNEEAIGVLSFDSDQISGLDGINEERNEIAAIVKMGQVYLIIE